MRASIIVAAHNEGDLLNRTLGSVVEAAKGLKYELLIADDTSTDGSVESAAAAYPRARVVRNEKRQGASGCKALGADHAKGDVLIFLDGHTKPEPGSLEALVDLVEATEGKDIITPRVATLDTKTWSNNESQAGHGYAINLDRMNCWWISRQAMKKVEVAERPMFESPALIGCAMAISRELYDRLRGFDKHMLSWGVEDLDFGLKAWLMGARILHTPKVTIGHRFRKTFTNFTVPMEHLISNQIRMARKNYTETVWEAWLALTKKRYPSTLWERSWDVYEKHAESAEEERSYLLAHRVHDELWYAARFDCSWPRLAGAGEAKRKNQHKNKRAAVDQDEAFEAVGSSEPPPPPPPPPPHPSSPPHPTPSPSPSPSPKVHLGFDLSGYPGDTAMANFIGNGAPFVFTGFYLGPAACHSDTGWMSKRSYLAGLGYGFLPIFVGQQAPGSSSCSQNNLTAVQGETDAADAITLAQLAGFGNCYIYLDIEQGGRLSASFAQYVAAWLGYIDAAGYGCGIYCSYTTVSSVRSLGLETTNPIRYWVFKLRIGCTTNIGTHQPSDANSYATSWQYAQNTPSSGQYCSQTWNGSTLSVDLDMSVFKDPSRLS